MADLLHRPRRLRSTPLMRRMLREHSAALADLIYPMFVTEGPAGSDIHSMPGIRRHTVDEACAHAELALNLGIEAVLLFGIPLNKDPLGSSAYDDEGIVAKSIRALKQSFGERLLVAADVCLCEYTSHGHCGVLREGVVENDATLDLLSRAAHCYADAGADLVAPSDMMDGRVAAIRHRLNCAGLENVPIMAYSAKYASAFYGPFREAAGSAPQTGDRRSYQMDPPNSREAMREVRLDVDEGADIVMVKPGLAYLDVVAAVRRRFDVPLAVYNVSGEYSMIKAAARNGWIDEQAVVEETLTAFKRAGADLILTYHALDYARWRKFG